MTDPTEDRMGGVAGVPVTRRPLSVSERAVFLELAELGVRRDAAARMAQRQPVRAQVVRGLRLKQAFDGHQAAYDAHDRWIRETGGPGAPGGMGTTPEFGKGPAPDVERALGGVTASAAALAAADQMASQVDAAFAEVPDVADLEAQIAQPQVKPVVIAGGAYVGGAEDFGGTALVLKVPMGEYLDGRVIDHQMAPGTAVGAAVAPSSVAASAIAAPSAVTSGAPGVATAVPLGDRARSSGLARQQAVASDVRLGMAIEIAAVALGVVSPAAGIAMYAVRRAAAGIDGL